MAGISSELHLRLRNALLKCAPVEVEKYARLKSLFRKSSLSPWIHQLPRYQDPETQADALINLLADRYHSTEKKNALVIFFEELSQQTALGDNCKEELRNLAHELEKELPLLDTATRFGQGLDKPESNKTIFLIFAIVAVIIVVFQLAKNLPPVISTPPPTIEARQTTSPQGVPLSIEEMYPQDTKCYVGGTWTVDLWVKPAGGNGTYTYYNNDEWVAGPTDTGVVISLQGETALVVEGIIIVDSDGQRKSQNYSVDMPEKCR